MGSIPVQDLIVWVIIGGLAGGFVGAVMNRNRRGFGLIGNIVIGLLGALVGGVLFNLLGIDLLSGMTISANDLLAAIVGAFILIFAMSFVRR